MTVNDVEDKVVMKYSSSEKAIVALSHWLETPPGKYIKQWEEARLNQLTADIFGFHAVQIGSPHIYGLQASRMPYRWVTDTHVPDNLSQKMGDELDQKHSVVLAHDFSELPFASHSLDLLILPHVLECSSDPHQILREVERVLIPEGRVIISGFNPTSLWGMRQMLGRRLGLYFLPQEGEFIHLHRLKDWLKLLNMEVNRGHFGCYAPPCSTEKWLTRFCFMELSGDRWWPYFGSIYMIQAIKRVRGMHLVGSVWTKKMKKSSAVPVVNKI